MYNNPLLFLLKGFKESRGCENVLYCPMSQHWFYSLTCNDQNGYGRVSVHFMPFLIPMKLFQLKCLISKNFLKKQKQIRFAEELQRLREFLNTVRLSSSNVNILCNHVIAVKTRKLTFFYKNRYIFQKKAILVRRMTLFLYLCTLISDVIEDGWIPLSALCTVYKDDP